VRLNPSAAQLSTNETGGGARQRASQDRIGARQRLRVRKQRHKAAARLNENRRRNTEAAARFGDKKKKKKFQKMMSRACAALSDLEILAIENHKLDSTFLHVAFGSQSLLKPTGDQTGSDTN
jgi:hypothetical protein